MNVSLTPELDELVNEKVRIGLYQTASEVIRDTLRLLKQRDDEALRAYQRVGLTEVGPEGHGDGAPAVAVGNADGVDRIDRTSLTNWRTGGAGRPKSSRDSLPRPQGSSRGRVGDDQRREALDCPQGLGR